MAKDYTLRLEIAADSHEAMVRHFQTLADMLAKNGFRDTSQGGGGGGGATFSLVILSPPEPPLTADETRRVRGLLSRSS